MPKDFTDYVLMVLDSGERVYHLVHLRNAKGCKINGNIYPMNDHNYLLNLDRAYRVNWAPWKKWVVKKPYWRNFYKPLIELTRSKKIGLLFYQEPCNHKCSACKIDCKTIPAKVEPMHISRIHQPSGEMKG
jgi:hypothetical protein